MTQKTYQEQHMYTGRPFLAHTGFTDCKLWLFLGGKKRGSVSCTITFYWQCFSTQENIGWGSRPRFGWNATTIFQKCDECSSRNSFLRKPQKCVQLGFGISKMISISCYQWRSIALSNFTKLHFYLSGWLMLSDKGIHDTFGGTVS